MLRVAKQALRLAPQLQAEVQACAVFTRGMAFEKTLADKEKAGEDIYFTKEDQRIMAKLLSKVKQQSDLSDAQGADGIKAAEVAGLRQIVEKYNVAKEDIEKLIRWKHTAY